MDRIENMFIADEAQLFAPRIISKAVVTDTWVTTDFANRLRKKGRIFSHYHAEPIKH
ncbi:MAG: hypothetical protein QXZ17_03650 [Nitrososphaerota archaeon]